MSITWPSLGRFSWLPSLLCVSGNFEMASSVGYRHLRIEHGAKVFATGNIHTNSIEGFWSLVKRGISGVYHAVSPKYLQSYLDEYSFRYNRRKDKQSMFLSFLDQVKRAETN